MSRIVTFARVQVGLPYVFGASGPTSFDCSGLTLRAAAQIGLAFYHGATKQWLRGHQDGTATRYGYGGSSRNPAERSGPDRSVNGASMPSREPVESDNR